MLLGLLGVVGLVISTFSTVKIPFAETYAKEYWRHALAGLILVLLLIGGIVASVAYLFDANYFKSQIVEYVKANNQRDLTLEGDIKVTFFPSLGLNSGKMSLSQRNSNKEFASIENARLRVAWWPLLRKQLRIERITLDRVRANVIRYKDGSTNLDDLSATDESLGDIKFEIEKIDLRNSSVNFQDESSGVVAKLRDVNIETGKLTDSIPGSVTANFRLESNKPRIETTVTLKSHVLFELQANHYEFANFEGVMEGEAAGITNLVLNFNGSLSSYPAEERLRMDKFSASAKGKLEKRVLDARLDIAKLQSDKNKLTGAELIFTAGLLQANENLTAALELPAIEMNDENILAENASVRFDLSSAGRLLQGDISSPMSFDFETRQIRLPAIVSGISGSHPSLAGKLNLNTTGKLLAKLAQQEVTLAFTTNVDDTNFKGSVQLKDFSNPAYSFDLAANTLDLDRYLASDWSKRLWDDAVPFDFSGIKELNLRGKLRSDRFKWANVKTRNLAADIRIGESTLSIESLQARLYGGTMAGSLKIAARDVPNVTLQQKLKGVQFDALLADTFPGEAKLVGKGNLALDVNATGENMGALRKTLSGEASLALERGSLAGINISEALLAGKDQLGVKDGDHSEPVRFTEASSFAALKAIFNISEGVARNTDFLMKSPLYTCKGEGEIALDSGEVKYQLTTTVAPGLKRNKNGALADLAGIAIPTQVNGPFATPSVLFSFGAASGGAAAKLAKTNNAELASPPVGIKKPVTTKKPAATKKPAKK